MSPSFRKVVLEAPGSGSQSVVQGTRVQQSPFSQPTQHANLDTLGPELTQHASSTQLPPRVAMLCLMHQLATLCKDTHMEQTIAQHVTAAGSSRTVSLWAK